MLEVSQVFYQKEIDKTNSSFIKHYLLGKLLSNYDAQENPHTGSFLSQK
jgi:hypothetical protein